MQKAPLNDKKTTHDHPKCEGIMPEHCDEIGQTTFTNDPADIFKEIKLLEDRYNYTISKMKEKMDKKVQDAQKEYGENYRTSLEGKKKQILQDVSELKKEIEKTLNY